MDEIIVFVGIILFVVLLVLYGIVFIDIYLYIGKFWIFINIVELYLIFLGFIKKICYKIMYCKFFVKCKNNICEKLWEII